MRIVEYKFNVREDGTVFVPGWIHKGAFFFNREDNTYIGLVLEPNERNYYVPDTVIELSLDEVKDRVKSFPRVEDTGGNTKSDEDLEAEVDQWWQEHNN